MMIRHRSKASAQSTDDHSDANERPIANRLEDVFPDQLKELFKLRSLRDLAQDSGFIDALGKIVYRNRGLADAHSKSVLSSIMQSADQAAEIIESIKGDILNLDSERLESALNLASQFLPAHFNGLSPSEFVDVLRLFQGTLLFFSLALELSSGRSQRPRRRGRPASDHVLAAVELIQLWEHVTGADTQEARQVKIKPVPTPKKDEGLIGQDSTEFVRIALQMINPRITDSQVFTAIKHALQVQREFYKFLPAESEAAKIMGTIFRMNERANLV